MGVQKYPIKRKNAHPGLPTAVQTNGTHYKKNPYNLQDTPTVDDIFNVCRAMYVNMKKIQFLFLVLYFVNY